MLRYGQEEELWGLGELETDSSPVDQRNSYLALLRGDGNPGPNVPSMGQRWVVIDNELFSQLSQAKPKPIAVDSSQLFSVARDLLVDGTEKSVPVPEIIKQFEDANPGSEIDIDSVLQAIKDAVAGGLIECRTGEDTTIAAREIQKATDLTMIPRLALPVGVRKGTVTVTAIGELEITGIAPLYKELLQPLDGQGPKSLKIRVNVTAVFDSAVGSGLDTIVDEAKSKNELKGIDIKKT